MSNISPELVDELVSFVRNAAESEANITAAFYHARAIVAKLPQPVDPDVVEARKPSELTVLIDGYTRAGINAARQGASLEPWYKNARADIAHAANCFEVAAALRALQQEESSNG